MKKFLLEGKLPKEWILYELFLQYEYTISPAIRISGNARNSKDYLADLIKKKSQLILKDYKKYEDEFISNRFASWDDSALSKKIKNIFYIDDEKEFKKNEEVPISEYWYSSMLGPLGPWHTNASIDLDLIKEVYVSNFNDSKNLIYGSCLTKSHGWISWGMVRGDKRFFKNLEFKTNFFISWNKNTKEASMDEMWRKYNKFKLEKFGRNFDIFKSIGSYWFVEDVNNFCKDIQNSSLHLPYKYEN